MFRSRIGSSSSSSNNQASSRKCQKCLQTGHSTFECKNPRPYQSRPTRSQAFSDPKTLKKMRENPDSVRLPDELRRNGTADTILAKRASERKPDGKMTEGKTTSQKKRKRSTSTPSSSSSSSMSSSSSSSSAESRGPVKPSTRNIEDMSDSSSQNSSDSDSDAKVL